MSYHSLLAGILSRGGLRWQVNRTLAGRGFAMVPILETGRHDEASVVEVTGRELRELEAHGYRWEFRIS